MQLAVVGLHGASHTEGLAQNERAHRHRGLVQRRQRGDAAPDRGRFLRLQPDQKTRDVDQLHDGQVKGLGQVDQARGLDGAVRSPGATVVVGVAAQQGHRPTV